MFEGMISLAFVNDLVSQMHHRITAQTEPHF